MGHCDEFANSDIQKLFDSKEICRKSEDFAIKIPDLNITIIKKDTKCNPIVKILLNDQIIAFTTNRGTNHTETIIIWFTLWFFFHYSSFLKIINYFISEEKFFFFQINECAFEK